MDNWNEKLGEKLAEYRYLKEPSEEKVNDFFSKMDGQKQSSKSAGSNWRLKIAASVALVVGILFLSYQLADNQISVVAGTNEMITLPDNSTVVLNGNSELNYNSLVWLWSRSVRLEGEGFFQVKKGSSFKVLSTNGSTEVLGTSFNVNARPDRYAVKCYTGKVRVRIQNQVQLLTPGKAVSTVKGEKVIAYNFNSKKDNSWQSDEKQFDNEYLEAVVIELEQAYDVNVELQDTLKAIRYSGYFPTDNLDLSLKLICDPLGLTFSKKDDAILINGVN